MKKVDELGITGITDLEMAKATSDAIVKSIGVKPRPAIPQEIHMTFEEWMVIQNLLWGECRDLETSLKIYPDKERYHKTHEYVAKTTAKLRQIGDKVEIYINRENDHPLWWKRTEPAFLKGGEEE